MARVKRGVTAHAKHKKILKAAKGYYGRRKNTIRVAKQAVERAQQYAYRDRKRKKRMSNEEWKSPSDGDARIAKMKDGRTHWAHKAEHAVDLDTGAVVAVTLQGADQGDTTTLDQTLCEAGMAVAEQLGREPACLGLLDPCFEVQAPAVIIRERITEIERPDWWPTEEEVRAALRPEAAVRQP